MKLGVAATYHHQAVASTPAFLIITAAYRLEGPAWYGVRLMRPASLCFSSAVIWSGVWS